MIKFSVFYPWVSGGWFDAKYYCEHHIAPYRADPRVKGVIVESGKSTRDFQSPPRYACIAHFFYDSEDALNESRTPERVARQIEDNVNFTNMKGFNLVSQMPYVDLGRLEGV